MHGVRRAWSTEHLTRHLADKARRLAERASRGVVLRRQLPAELGAGTLFVSPDARLRLWHPRLKHSAADLLPRVGELVRPGDVVWDVGSNVGIFAFAAAARAGVEGRVLSIEPDDWLLGLQRRSLAAQPGGQAEVDLLSVAVSDRLGLADLSIAARGRAANHLCDARGSSQTGGARETRRVVCVTLDWLLDYYPSPDLIKVDVEGAELQLLAGAKRILEEVRPLWLCEVRPEAAEEIAALWQSAGYALFDASHPLAAQGKALELPACDTLAVPKERLRGGLRAPSLPRTEFESLRSPSSTSQV